MAKAVVVYGVTNNWRINCAQRIMGGGYWSEVALQRVEKGKKGSVFGGCLFTQLRLLGTGGSY